MQNKIVTGSIVKYTNPTDGSPGHYRVSSVRGGKVNLKSVFGNRIYYKGIPVELVCEDEDTFYDRWSKSESYMCM